MMSCSWFPDGRLRGGLREHEKYSYRGKSEIQEIQIFGDFAFLRNHIRMTATPLDGGATISRSGYTLTILRKEHDGRWRLSRDANLLTTQQAPATAD
jgi:uncharacterized protein (TIGR02246 family)